MLNQEMLLERAEAYLKSLFSETLESLGSDFDSATPFGELGIDSFRVLKLIKALEADFGTLPKTLLFEAFNVDALTQYFVDKHEATLRAKLEQQPVLPRQGVAPAAVQTLGATNAAPTLRPATAPARQTLVDSSAPWPQTRAPAPSVKPKSPIRLLEKNLPLYPELQAQIEEIFERHKNEGCVSRGTRNIAPNLFIGSARKGYFNYSRSKDIVLVYAYTGPQDYFPDAAAEMLSYCTERGYQLNIFVDQLLAPINGVAFSATPFGALQRMVGLQEFSLDGGAMRRLRYQVSKFEKAGVCCTREYHCGTDKAVDQSIAQVIDKWCETKTMVNPLIHIVKDEIVTGTLHAQHRIFLTTLDEVLQNVILISGMSRELNGYLMDLEFYSKDMPLGGLEYAIVNIAEALKREGHDLLSLGGTYGCRLEVGPQADPEVDKILDELHTQKIFNDESNLQFKNKFRPENRTIYLCRPVGSGKADNVIDIIMMIADPAKQSSEAENHNVAEALASAASAPAILQSSAAAGGMLVAIDGEPRSRALAESGYNPLNLAHAQVDYDLKTDSWAQLEGEFVGRQMKHLRAQLQQPANLNEVFKAIFPFKHFVLTESGRASDHVLCKAWPKRGIVLQNLLFPTCIYHQIDKGFTPVEIPGPALFALESSEPYKGNVSIEALQQQLATRVGEIAYVCIEVNDNSAGGQPVSLAHLKQIKALLAPHAIPLVIDSTRVLENARFLIEREPEHAQQTLWEVTAALLSQADVVIGALAKDFCVNKGGVLATNDEALLKRFQDVIEQEGGGLDVIDKKLIALSLGNRAHIEAQVLRKMGAARSIWQALAAAQLPVVHPAGGHCVLIDIKRIPEFAQQPNPVGSFLAWLYLNTGIRAGLHSVGMQNGTPLNGVVRFAIPVGLKQEEADDIAARLVRLFQEKKNIPELAASDAVADVHARFTLQAYHRASGALVQLDAETPPAAASSAVFVTPTSPARTAIASATSTSSARPRGDIAVVGMAGRYPKAKNLAEFWANLRDGRDCITEISDERMARRADHALTRRYRGGFIDEIDRFDSLFFNISPREAEVLDPQERLFLEVAWEALEDAGYCPETLAQDKAPRRVGVFVGAVWAMYQMVGAEQKLAGRNLNPNSFLWSIANRVSYWMNLTGPSLTVDTACSSSLTALHLACEAIHNGDCASALVGGVNLDVHQHKFDINSAGGALSSDGVCRTFGAGANGYVAGEGVGALYLKPLAQALEDRDQVYGVIKGVAVNHGGRTSGYTVPNPKAQGDLVAAALAHAGVEPHSIGYIEAHGTGTELGDPVEISGLGNAFSAVGAGTEVARQSCPVGSVKTNIGHLEAAAGVVGVCKVLLQMKYRQLVPSLHSAQLNAHIDFAQTAFYVQQQLQDWAAKTHGGAELPLRAGVSSFGAGGANAHVVLESRARPAEAVAETGTVVFPLSARNDEQLRDMAARLRSHLQLDFVQPPLADVAYTLQNGRKSFEHRLVVIAATLPMLIDKLGLFLEGREDADVLTGHAKNAEGLTKRLSRKEKEQFVALLAESRDPHKLAQLWIDGLLSDCRGFASTGGRRTSLPTYPFADKRHWIGASEGAVAGTARLAGVHPLIDSNESTFSRQVFKKTFQPHEFFVRDHVVSGVPTLPGTAYLELARKAGELAAGLPVASIRNVTWVSPLTVEEGRPTPTFIELKPSGDTVPFEVYSELAEGRRRLHAQGRIVYAASGAAMPAHERLDLAAVRARCTGTIDAKDAYPLFQKLGMYYGPSFQVLQQVRTGAGEVLGELRIPAQRSGDFDAYVLHPSVLDAAMQAGVMAQLSQPSGEMMVPYSIGEVEFVRPLTRSCYSHLTKSTADKGATVSREHVTIVDDAGEVLVRIRDAVGVPLVNVHEKAGASALTAADKGDDEAFKELYYATVWKAAPLADAQPDARSLLIYGLDDALHRACAERGLPATLVLPGEAFEDLGGDRYRIRPQSGEDHARVLEALARQGRAVEKACYAWAEPALPADVSALDAALARGVSAFLRFCQALVEQKLAGRVQMVYLNAGAATAVPPHVEAINGFVRSLRLENPKIDAKVLDVLGADVTSPELLDTVLAELHASLQDDITVRHTHGNRQVRTLARLDAAVFTASNESLAFKQRGVYLVTGGAGGLGLIFAEELARQCQARLVLTGRSKLPAEREADLQRLRALGAEVIYLMADVSRAEDVQRILAKTRKRFGRLDGIVHSAGVLRDSLLRKKTPEELAAVLAPKVHGSFHLDEQTQGDDLDFFVSFSSLAAIGGNTGQCDYAYANHYLDAFAAQREAQRAQGLRQGRTLSLNWSLWAEGGMKLDAPTEAFFRKNLGIKPLATEVGLRAFAQGLKLGRPQIAVLEGVREKIELAWGLVKKEAAPAVAAAAPTAASVSAAASAAPATAASPSGRGEGLAQQVIQRLSKTVMEMLKIDADELQLDSILLDLGFDSIGLTTFANAINEVYRLDINPVMFFEHPSIRAIATVLVAEHAEAVQKVHGSGGAAPAALASAPAVSAAPVATAPALSISKGWPVPGATLAQPEASQSGGDLSRETRFTDMPIAIVGMGGTMPQSDSLEDFWDHLKNARNLVTEIPRDRWIWEDYDGNPLKEPNKSYSRWGGFLKEVDKFDPLFFGITPREAEMMDPQQRLFIEAVWSAIEDSGHKVSDLSGSQTGVFVGVSASDYIDVLAEQQSSLDGYSASGNSHSILANRISYLFNLRGPSAPLDTACSSSLVALHRAIESIHTGSSEMAIVGGVQVMLTPVAHISLSAAGMLSVDGKCKTFNKDANGYVRGEGAGAIFIKPLARALADGDPIRAVIRATAENHGGRVTNLTAPNPKAQAELLIEAYGKARIDPGTVGYIECHGTGTSLGDPIEIQALKKAFSDLYKQHQRPAPTAAHCGLSSVKTNVGHLEPAAGMAGLLKVLLAMKHQHIPALLHFEELNPYIDLKGSPFYIADKTVPWAPPQAADGTLLPRRAGISAFGWGGANAHVVLEEHLPAARAALLQGQPVPIVLSARSPERLKACAGLLLKHLSTHDVELADFAHTLQNGRDVMAERLGFIAGSVAEVKSRLQAFIDQDGEAEVAGVARGKASRKGSDLLGQDEDVKASVVEKLVSGGQWAKLLGLWVQGLDFDWATWLPLVGARRLHLPTYPFARERHWIDTTAKAPTPAAVSLPAAAVAPATVRSAEAPQRLFFRETWLVQPAPPAASMPLSAGSRRSLVFVDDALQRTLQAADEDHEALQRSGLADAVLVRPGASLKQISERLYECPRGDVKALQSLIEQVPLGAGQALGIVHAWSRGRGQAGVHQLFGLFSAIKAALRPVAHVTLVGEHDPARLDTCWDVSWIGFERSLKLQLAKTEIALLYGDSLELGLDALADALRQGGAIAYRGGERRVLVPQAFEPSAANAAPVLKKQGGYLITGGIGALGLQFARHLATTQQARLLLLGRRPMSPQIEQQLEALRQAGATQAVYQPLDLGDAEAVAAWARELPFELSGVIHAAGVESNQAFFEKTAAGIDEVLQPKTVGTLQLDEALRAQPLDFVCCFSSSSAVLGDFGACDYAVANRFQMAYGEHRRLSGAAKGRTLVINWPLWAEGGMGVADPQQSALYLKRTGLEALGSAEGLRIFETLLQSGESQALVLAGLPSRIGLLLDRIHRIQRPQWPAPVSAAPAPVPAALGSAAIGELIDAIKARSRMPLATGLGHEQIDKLKQLIKADLLSLQEGGK